MRILKKDLQRALADAAIFNQLPLMYLTETQEAEARTYPDFISPEKYGRGMLQLRDEIGTDGKYRFLRRRV